jgi:hypothetical protein
MWVKVIKKKRRRKESGGYPLFCMYPKTKTIYKEK